MIAPQRSGELLAWCVAAAPGWVGPWELILGQADCIPITGPLPDLADLPGLGLWPCYWLRLEALTPNQKEVLVGYLARTFGLPLAEVLRDIDSHGCPMPTERYLLPRLEE